MTELVRVPPLRAVIRIVVPRRHWNVSQVERTKIAKRHRDAPLESGFPSVEPDSIGWSMFGLDDADDPYGQNVHDRLCRELAAMSVSRRLLKACGREDIAQLEVEETDSVTLRYLDEPKARRRVDAILREHGCLRIPRTRDALAAKFERIHVNP